MIGILPCAGKAERIYGLPKYLLPCPGGYLLKRHIEGMKAAGCSEVRIGTSLENDEIIFDYTDGAMSDVAVNRDTMTQTVQSMRMYSRGENILFGMPDTYFESPDVYKRLAGIIDSCDVLVAVCKARIGQYEQGGVVRLSSNDAIVLDVLDKPTITPADFKYIWGALAWKPSFWDCLSPEMSHVGYGLNVAIERGLSVLAIVIEGNFYDCGTPERYFEMIRNTTCDPLYHS